VADLFSLINISSDGRIDFDEFRLFYDAVLAYTNTRQQLQSGGGGGGSGGLQSPGQGQGQGGGKARAGGLSYESEAAQRIDQIIFEDQFRCFGFDF
jgi:hypothetical protein